MSNAFRQYLKDRLDIALTSALNEFDNITFSEIMGTIEMFKLGIYQEYLEADSNGPDIERLGETPEIPDGCSEGRYGIEGIIPPTEPDSEAPSSDTQPEGCD